MLIAELRPLLDFGNSRLVQLPNIVEWSRPVINRNWDIHVTENSYSYRVEEISHKRIVHKNRSVYVTHIYSLNGHLTRKSVYAKSPLFHIFLVWRTFYPVQWLGEVGHPFTALLDLHHFISFQRSALCRRKMWNMFYRESFFRIWGGEATWNQYFLGTQYLFFPPDQHLPFNSHLQQVSN